MKGRIRDLGFGLDGTLTVSLSLPRQYADDFHALIDADVSVEVKKWREKRSMSQNAYAWVLIGKIAQCISPPMNKEEVYVEMLKRYGQGGIISIQKDKLDMTLRAFDYYAPKGEGTVNGKEFIHMMVYVGSSKYYSKEMATFISGIVEDAKELGIETLTPDEIAKLEGIR